MLTKIHVRDGNRLVESLVFLAIGISLLLYSRGMWSAKLAISMSPYLFPFMVGCAFAVLALILLSQSLGTSTGSDAAAARPSPAHLARNLDWRSVAILVGFSLAYYLLLPVFHFMPATALFLFCLLYFLGEKRLWLDVAVAVGTTAAIYVSFGILLNVMLP